MFGLLLDLWIHVDDSTLLRLESFCLRRFWNFVYIRLQLHAWTRSPIYADDALRRVSSSTCDHHSVLRLHSEDLIPSESSSDALEHSPGELVRSVHSALHLLFSTDDDCQRGTNTQLDQYRSLSGWSFPRIENPSNRSSGDTQCPSHFCHILPGLGTLCVHGHVDTIRLRSLFQSLRIRLAQSPDENSCLYQPVDLRTFFFRIPETSSIKSTGFRQLFVVEIPPMLLKQSDHLHLYLVILCFKCNSCQ